MNLKDLALDAAWVGTAILGGAGLASLIVAHRAPDTCVIQVHAHPQGTSWSDVVTATGTRAFVTVAVPTTVAPNGAVITSNPPVERIEEDDPRWDCHTMGNQVCGNPSAFSVDGPDGSV